MFTKFSDNDEDIAWEYAFSLETARKNNVKFDYNSVEYEIEHDNISINDILNAGDESVVFKIQTGFEFELKLSSVIRHCLGVSASQLNQMIEVDAVFTPEGYPIKKHKVKNGDIVLINKEKLQGIKSLGSV